MQTRTLWLLLVLFTTACGQPNPATLLPKSPSVRELRIGQLHAESPEHGMFGQALTHHALLGRIAQLTSDENARGLLLRVGPFEGSFARSAELAASLLAFRDAGKPVHCHFEMADNSAYAVLARACERISMAPAGVLDLVGVASETVYAAELLASIGVRADLIQIGRYKGAADALTRTSMPDEVRENTEALLSELHGALLSAVAEGRKLTPEHVQSVLDQGPFNATHALAHGLVDALGFDDAARTHAKNAAKVDTVEVERLGPERTELSFFDLLQALSGKGRSAQPTGPRIALAYLDGTILSGNEEVTRSAHAAPFVKALRALGDVEDVKAVVLRIDSPGGSATAADAMWHAVRRVAKRKPVIVSLGDLAASGGYYVASAGTRVLARDESIVGSIGVVGGKIVGQELGERLGVRSERIARGKHARWASSLTPFSQDERAVITSLLEDTYARFLQRIGEGRNLPKERILPLAEGRIMSGRHARQGGLVDEAGGLREALALARSMGKVSADAPIEIWPPQQTLLDQLAQLTSESSVHAGGAQLLARMLPTRMTQGLSAALLAGPDLQLAVLPFALDIR